ncbi:ArsC family reductase [Shewanella waksmanii]|uniref:ArsC family reductase n=1 Tax=Shewanella waksmanii TaxID=213783 RepID=UPI00048DFBA3|nr:ArsC family reductase [Shewanella waksmanii]
MTLYGIKNCDTVRKAKKWLETNNIEVKFHDFRADGISADIIEQWLTQVDWETLFNKRSTSFRALSDTDKADIDQQKAISLMVSHPTLIKRPVLVLNDQVLVGFKAELYQGALS